MFRRHPSDEDTANAMRRLAETFVATSAEDGMEFGWDATEASRLDDLCDAFLVTNPPADVRHSAVMAVGAYLGELMVRYGGVTS